MRPFERLVRFEPGYFRFWMWHLNPLWFLDILMIFFRIARSQWRQGISVLDVCSGLGYASKKHCVKSVLIRSYSGPPLPAFGLNTERYSISLRSQSECGKTRTRITPNTDTFYAMKCFWKKDWQDTELKVYLFMVCYKYSQP